MLLVLSRIAARRFWSVPTTYVFMEEYAKITLNYHQIPTLPVPLKTITATVGERGGSVVECRTPEREVRGSRPTAAVLCPWARHFTPRKYWLITQEAMAPSRHDWKIVDWDVKPQHNQPTATVLTVNLIMQKVYYTYIT